MGRKILLHGDATMKIKSILFNTEMIRAILEGRKTVTRRVVKPQPKYSIAPDYKEREPMAWWVDNEQWVKPPYCPGDIMYVRETWKIVDFLDGLSLKFEYAADGKISDFIDFTSERLQKFLKYINRKKWCPARFMPREAARIFLRVTDVRVERLWDITDEQAMAEGYVPYNVAAGPEDWTDEPSSAYKQAPPSLWFRGIWDSVIKPKDRALYGWEANPWIFVISFDRISKNEALQ